MPETLAHTHPGTETAPSGPKTATTTVRDLVAIFTALAPFAGFDDDLPTLTAIQIRTTDGRIEGTATNRYRLARCSRPATGALADPVYVRAIDAQAIVGWLRTRAEWTGDDRELVELSVHDGRLAVAVGDFKASPRIVDGTGWPDLDAVLNDTRDPEPCTRIGLGLDNLKALVAAHEAVGSVGAERIPARWTIAGAERAIRVEIGDGFLACVMPCRLDGPVGR
jgi:hypothetical protein